MRRQLNRELLSALQARTKPALESEEVVVTPAATEGDADSTVTAVAAAAGEGGAAAPAAEVTITVKVETPDAGASAAAAAETPPATVDIADPSAPAADLSVDAAGAPDATATTVVVDAPAGDAAVAEIPAGAAEAPAGDAGITPEAGLETPDAAAAVVPPAEGTDAAAVSAEVPAEGDAAATPTEGGEAPAAASAETPTEGVVETPTEGTPSTDAEVPAEGAAVAAAEVPAEGAAPAATPAEGAAAEPATPAADVTPETGSAQTPTEGGDAAAVDANPSNADEAAAAAEVQAAIDATKAEGEAETEAGAAKEDIAVVVPEGGDTAQVENALPVIDEVEAIHEGEIAPDIEEVAAELDAYQDGAETMAKIAAILEEAAEEGGINEAGAKVMEVAVEHIHNQLGLKKPVGIMAMETFALPGGDRIDATSVAMEAVSETVQNVWKTILAGLQKFMGMVVEFYNKLSSGALIQKQQADALLAQAQALGDKKVAGVISSPTLTHKLAVQGNLSQNLSADLVNSGRVCIAAIQQGFALAQAGRALLQQQDISAGKAALLEGLTKAVSAVMSANANPAEVGMEAAPDGTVAYTSPIMLGNYVLTACLPKGVEELGKAQFGVANFEPEFSKTDLPILNTEQIATLAKVVQSHAGALADMKKAEAEVKAMAQAFQAYANKSEGAGSKPDATIVRLVKEFTAGLLRNSAKVLYANNAAVLEYCNVSLKKLSGKVEGAAPAATPAAA